jgi:hypothetical protein
LDASVQVEADDRAGLGRLLRYCARPIFAMERLTWVARDHNRLVYHLPKPMPDGRSQLDLTPLELLDRLVSAQINLTLIKPSLAKNCSLYLAPARTSRCAPTLRNPASLAYQPKPSLAWAFAAQSQLTPATLEAQGSPPDCPLAAP